MELEFFTTNRGDSPVFDFINNSQDQKHKKAIVRDLEILREYGLFRLLQTKDVEKMKGIKYKVYELKTKIGGLEYRIFFGFKNDTAYLVHAIIKKTQKTPKQDIDLTIKRLKMINII